MSTTLPDIYGRSGYLPASNAPGQNIFYEDRGPKDAPAVMFAHGMTGYTFDLNQTRLFPAGSRRLIAPHMRGLGASTPNGATDHNLVPDMARDMDDVRSHLDVGKLDLLIGWSGGSAAALADAEARPDSVGGIVLYGTWLGTENELIDYYGRAASINPQGWQQLLDFTGKTKTADVLAALGKGIARRDDDPARALDAVIRHEMLYETSPQDYKAFKASRSPDDWQAKLRQRAVTFNMYDHAYGLKPDQLEENIGLLADIPMLIVHGENDTEVTPDAGRRLAAKLPLARHVVLPGAGHDMREPAVQAALRPLIAEYFASGQPATVPVPTPSI